MYFCTDCKKNFFDPKVYFERHAFLPPPYEKHIVCPYCESENIIFLKARHCKCCGARLPYKNSGDYCDDACRKRGERLWKTQKERREKRNESPIYKTVRALVEYNKTHGTHLSYGQFEAILKKGGENL